MKRVVCLFAVIVIRLCSAAPAFAQQSGPQALDGPAASIQFLPRYDFQLEANVLSGDNGRQYRWDAHFGGEFDLINYIKGRLTIVTDYEAVMGSELRPFDPNQGNYVLEPAASWFIGKHEVEFAFHHVSRHLSDRPKAFAIAWNIAEGRYLRKLELPHDTSLSIRAGAGRIIQHSQVDYTWAADFDVVARRVMNPHLDLYTRTSGEFFGVDPAIRGRDNVQHTTRVELGVRVKGGKADLELFLGAEHRLDASIVDFVPVAWAIAGFRIASK